MIVLPTALTPSQYGEWKLAAGMCNTSSFPCSASKAIKTAITSPRFVDSTRPMAGNSIMSLSKRKPGGDHKMMSKCAMPPRGTRTLDKPPTPLSVFLWQHMGKAHILCPSLAIIIQPGRWFWFGSFLPKTPYAAGYSEWLHSLSCEERAKADWWK